MKQFGAFDAKTHFSEILNSVAQGEKCVITRHGIKVALLIPFSVDESMNPAQEAIRAIRTIRKGITLGKKLSIKKLRAEGRR